MASRDELSPPASTLQGELLSLLREQKSAAEETAVRDMLLGEVSASKEIEQLATYLLAFEGAAATVVILNMAQFYQIVGERAVALALVLLTVAGSAGLLIRWLGFRLQAFLRIVKEARKAPVQESSTSQVVKTVDPDLPEHKVVETFRERLSELTVDHRAVARRFRAEYASTLSRLGRWLEAKEATTSDHPFADVRRMLRRQHWQRRLLILQAMVTLGFVLAAGVVAALKIFPKP